MPPDGFLNTLEVRFALDPTTLLLLSWTEDRDAPEPLDGTFIQACEANCAVSCYQADQEYRFFRPGTVPRRLVPPWQQAARRSARPQLLPGYDVRSARRSGEARRPASDLTLVGNALRGHAATTSCRPGRRWPDPVRAGDGRAATRCPGASLRR